MSDARRKHRGLPGIHCLFEPSRLGDASSSCCRPGEIQRNHYWTARLPRYACWRFPRNPRPFLQCCNSCLRSSDDRQSIDFRLHSSRPALRSASEWGTGQVRRKCLLCIPRREDSVRLVRDRQVSRGSTNLKRYRKISASSGPLLRREALRCANNLCRLHPGQPNLQPSYIAGEVFYCQAAEWFDEGAIASVK